MNVLIGKRELFAFAERYSECRIKEYSELADGYVLCCLFGAVFPGVSIRPASSRMHSRSKVAHANWSALLKSLCDVGIPPSLLNRERLQCGDVESGFSALVLFYFLFHLSRRSDFSAEFAADVTQELTDFLQSVDSIAALVKGGAMPLTAVPLPLREQLRGAALKAHECREPAASIGERGRKLNNTGLGHVSLPSTSATIHIEGDDSEINKRSTNAGPQGRLVFSSPAKVAQRMVDKSPKEVQGEERKAHSSSSACNLWRGGPTQHEDMSVEVKNCDVRQQTEEKGYETVILSIKDTGNESASSLLPREPDLQRALIAKEVECEDLRTQNTELLCHLTRLRVQYSMKEDLSHDEVDTITKNNQLDNGVPPDKEERVHHFHSTAQDRKSRCFHIAAECSTHIEQPLRGAVGAEADAVVDVASDAGFLNAVLVDVLRDVPLRLREAQRCLWRIVSAFNVVEERLAMVVGTHGFNSGHAEGDVNSSCDNTSEDRKSPFTTPRLPTTPCTTKKLVEPIAGATLCASQVPTGSSPAQDALLQAEREILQRQKQFEKQLEYLHDNEAQLQQSICTLRGEICRLVQRSEERDLAWKSLCSAIRDAERTSLLIAEAESEEDIERLLERRNACYARADAESLALLREEGQDGVTTAVSRSTTDCHSVCETMKVLVESVTQDRDRLAKELEALRSVEEGGCSGRKTYPLLLGKGSLRKTLRRLLSEDNDTGTKDTFVRANSFPSLSLSPYPGHVRKKLTYIVEDEEREAPHAGCLPSPRRSNISKLLS